MSIIRAARKERDFAILSNALLQDSRLSMRGLGLLVRLLSRPDNWETNSEILAREFNCGREQMRAVLCELRDLGYMSLVKYQDEKGHWSSKWYVHESPENQEPSSREPEPGNRVLGSSDAINKTDYKEPIPRTDKPRKRVSSAKTTLSEYLEQCKAAGTKPIPDDHCSRQYARDAGISSEMIALAWFSFLDTYRDGTGKSKKYVDWGLVFNNAVKGNWAKLWYVARESGTVNWTSEGLLYKATIDAKLGDKK